MTRSSNQIFLLWILEFLNILQIKSYFKEYFFYFLINKIINKLYSNPQNFAFVWIKISLKDARSVIMEDHWIPEKKDNQIFSS